MRARSTAARISSGYGWAARGGSCTSFTHGGKCCPRMSRGCRRTGDSPVRRAGVMRGDLRRAPALGRRRPHRGPAVRLRFLEKPDCGLCAETYRALRRVALDVPLDVERVDITE